MKLDPIGIFRRIPNEKVRLTLLGRFLDRMVPFNRGLDLKVQELSVHSVEILSPDRKHRRNHLGGAHACALATMGEYPAGLLVIQMYPFDRYRLIMSELKAEYFKQGRGDLIALTKAPEEWPEVQDGEAWVELDTEIKDGDNELVAKIHTRWQIKDWSLVRKRYLVPNAEAER